MQQKYTRKERLERALYALKQAWNSLGAAGEWVVLAIKEAFRPTSD